MFIKRMGMRPVYCSPEDGGGSGGGDGGNGGGDAGGDKGGQGSNSGGDGGKQGADGQQQQRQQETKFELPEAYREKAHFKNFKSHDDVYKALDGAQELIGKKTIGPIDYATATPEQIAEHHGKLAPTDGAYDFGKDHDPAFAKEVGAAFKELGINAFQGKGLAEKVTAIAAKIAGDQGKAETSPEVYNELMIKKYGDKEKAGVAGKFLDNEIYAKHFSEDERKTLNSLPSKALAAVDQAVFQTAKAYEARIAAILKEHGVTESGVQTSGGEGRKGNDVVAQRKEQRAVIRKIESNPHHTHDEISAAKAKLAKMY